MIFLGRLRQGVPARFRDPKRTARERLLLDPAHPLKSADWSDAKPNLRKESGDCCAWCGAPTAEVAHGDVEHIRPKASWRHLAYCYDNYVFSCQICNQTYKGDGFPLAGAPHPSPGVAGRLAPDPLDAAAVDAYVAACLGEQPLLIVPTMEDPAGFFAWKADDVLQEVRVVPARPEVGPRVEATVALLGLNRPELLGRRFERYDELMFVIESPPSAKRTQQLDRMSKIGRPFAGMVRYFRGVHGV